MTTRFTCSVVIPAYNASATLPAQLRALAAQEPSPHVEGDLEVVVVDNRSTDGTAEVVARLADELADRLPRLRCLSAPDQPGASYARDVGSRSATGELLLYCDSDDVVSPGWAAAFAAAAAGGAVAMGGVVVRRLGGSGQEVGRRGLDDTLRFLPRPIGASCAIRRDVLEAAGGWPREARTSEESYLYWRVQLLGHPLMEVEGATVDYNERAVAGDLFRQRRNFGRGDVDLYVAFRDAGMPRPVAWRSALRVVRHLLELARAGRDPIARREPVRGLAVLAGHAQGSWRRRTLYF